MLSFTTTTTHSGWDGAEFLDRTLSEAADRHAVMYACAFLPAVGGDAAAATGGSTGGGGAAAADAPGLLAGGHSTGAIRVYDCRRASHLWLGSRRATAHCAQWRAHEGGVYALAIAGAGSGSPVLLSCGDDGALKGWSVAAIAEATAQQQRRQQEQQERQTGGVRTGGGISGGGSGGGGETRMGRTTTAAMATAVATATATAAAWRRMAGGCGA